MNNFASGHASDAEWDAFVGSHSDGHHEQTSRYAKSRAGYGFTHDRVVIRDGSRIVGGLQVLVQSTSVGKFALILRGPLAEDDNPTVLTHTVRELERLAGARSLASIRVDTFPTQVAARRALEAEGFLSSTAWHGSMPSILVPVRTFTDEELLALMKPNGRRDVRFAERAGVTVRCGDESALDDFLVLHDATAKYQGFPIFSREYFQSMWQIFGGERKLPLFLAYHDAKPIAAVLNILAGGRLYYTWGGMDRSDAVRKLNANCLLHYFAMGWARDNACTHYDLSGISGFKEKLGGEQIDWPLPLRKFFGPYRDFRKKMLEKSWLDPRWRRGVEFMKRRMNLEQRMPY
jgi:peptidoglycan pentaglycine glycine transferase (the first glycine)